MIDIFARARAFALREQKARDAEKGRIEQLAKEASDLASEWDVEHNFSHFFDDE